MNKKEFLDSLENNLAGLLAEDRREILYDYEEHFRIGLENGQTEEEIADSLGDAKAIARQFKADYTLQKAEASESLGDVVRAVFAFVALSFFNLVFVLGPFVGLLGILMGLFGAAAVVTVAGLAAVAGAVAAPFVSIIHLGVTPACAVFVGIGMTSSGLLFLIGDFYLTRFLYKGTVRYLRWNMEIIKK